MKKVLKYGTGQEIPEGAIYLYTRIEKIKEKAIGFDNYNTKEFVWHYFLVEEKN